LPILYNMLLQGSLGSGRDAPLSWDWMDVIIIIIVIVILVLLHRCRPSVLLVDWFYAKLSASSIVLHTVSDEQLCHRL
jgi:hypothetical protein